MKTESPVGTLRDATEGSVPSQPASSMSLSRTCLLSDKYKQANKSPIRWPALWFCDILLTPWYVLVYGVRRSICLFLKKLNKIYGLCLIAIGGHKNRG